jgi:hypothetical protein
MNTTTTLAPPRVPGRPLVALGFGLAAFGLITYVVQLAMQSLMTPWYLPVLATLGALVLVAALWQARTVWRILILVLVVLFAAAGWTFLLAARLPAYAGPVAAGKPFPAFATERADGTPFTHRDLEGEQNSVLVFFRGRW